jgi:YqaJ-like viral recombinase domain
VRILPGEQGSEAWHDARRGIPTASQFHRILSPAKLEPSAQRDAYLYELVAERLLGQDFGPDATQFMDRGLKLEDDAVRFYEFAREVETQKCGLCVTDDGLVGCSPDRLVGDEGGLELKTPSAPVHIGYVVDGLGVKFRLQVQGALWVTGRDWWDLCSYNPELKPALVRCYPDKEVFAALDAHLPAFLQRLDRITEQFGGAPKMELAEVLTRSIERAEHGLPQEKLPL